MNMSLTFLSAELLNFHKIIMESTKWNKKLIIKFIIKEFLSLLQQLLFKPGNKIKQELFTVYVQETLLSKFQTSIVLFAKNIQIPSVVATL